MTITWAREYFPLYYSLPGLKVRFNREDPKQGILKREVSLYH